MPLVGVTVSQAESLLAVKLSVPTPVFVTFTDCDDGLDPACVALKVSALDERCRMGDGGFPEPAGVTLSAQIQP